MGFGPGEREYSEQTAQEIDQEKNRIIDEAHQKVLLKLKNYRDPLKKFAGILLEKESIDGEELRKFAEEIRIQAASAGEPIEAQS
jgi:cell division protease FtsH